MRSLLVNHRAEVKTMSYEQNDQTSSTHDGRVSHTNQHRKGMFRGSTVLVIVLVSILVSSMVTMLVFNPEYEVSPSVSQPSNPSASSDGIDESKLAKISEAYQVIMENYVLEVDETALIEGAIEGMLNTLEDPYSVYMSPETAEQFQQSLSSSFEGIGAEVMLKDGRVTIVSPIKDSPAEKAGIRTNDQIISVNGENIEGMDLNQAVLKIRGPKGTEAVLEIIRPGMSEPITITVIRDEIPLETVYSERINANGKTFGKIELTSFAQNTADRFAEELNALEQEGIDGLIIDVRGNPGGYLNAVDKIGQLIVPNKSVITEIRDRTGVGTAYRSNLDDKKPYPIVILTNEGSASASEILAAALQEAGNYKVVGEPSFGKGTVQSTVTLHDNSQIKITVAKWLTPSQEWINETGVQPDILVSQPDYFKAAPIMTDPVLQKDMNNSQVENLQIILKGIGYDPGRTDGYFSAETEQAVKAFQEDNDLNVSGKVDEETAIKLQDTLVEVIRDPQRDRQLQEAVQTLIGEIQ